MLMGSNGVVERDFYIGERARRSWPGRSCPTDTSSYRAARALNKEGREAGLRLQGVAPQQGRLFLYGRDGRRVPPFRCAGQPLGTAARRLHRRQGGSSVCASTKTASPISSRRCPTRATASSGWSRPPTAHLSGGPGRESRGHGREDRPGRRGIQQTPSFRPRPTRASTKLGVLPTGELLVGGHDSKNSYFAAAFGRYGAHLERRPGEFRPSRRTSRAITAS